MLAIPLLLLPPHAPAKMASRRPKWPQAAQQAQQAQQQAAQGNNAGILTGWGPSTGAPGAPGGEAIPAQTPPAVTPQHHPGPWPSQTRDKHGNSWKYSDMP